MMDHSQVLLLGIQLEMGINRSYQRTAELLNTLDVTGTSSYPTAATLTSVISVTQMIAPRTRTHLQKRPRVIGRVTGYSRSAIQRVAINGKSARFKRYKEWRLSHNDPPRAHQSAFSIPWHTGNNEQGPASDEGIRLIHIVATPRRRGGYLCRGLRSRHSSDYTR
jgi:hypothetical protein